MGIILITISFLAILWRLTFEKVRADGIQSAFLQASVGHGVIIVLSTEILSKFRLLNFISLYILWGLIAAINIARLFAAKTRQNAYPGPFINHKLIYDKTKTKSLADKIAVTGVLLILAICLITGLISPPNNYDSMTYHMPRIMHWIQNQSVEHYPTHNLRQISFPPGISYIVVQFQLLSGGDFLANMVQWLAFLGCILGTSLLSKCSCQPEDQQTTALICASIPMAIMQSTTTQTDLAATFWVICFAYFTYRTNEFRLADYFWLAASLGLAILAKPTAAIFCIPIIALLVVRLAGSLPALRDIKTFIRSTCLAFIVSVAALLLSFPYYWRNIVTFRNFLGIDNGTRVESIGLDILISNILRNIALNLPLTYFWELIIKLHGWLLMLDLNDPKSTFLNNEFNLNVLQRLILPDEDFIANPIHLILIFCAIGALLIFYFSRKMEYIPCVAKISACSIFGFVLYCMLIKWQIWGNRLLLPFFILNAPLIAYFINHFMSNNTKYFLIGWMFITSVFYSLTPIHHPLVSLPQKWTNHSQSKSILTLKRQEIYHSSYGKGMKAAYEALKVNANNKLCRFIGLDIGEDDCEYPIWITLGANGINSFKIKHANVQNISKIAVEEFQDENICILFKKRGRYIKISSRNATGFKLSGQH